MEFLRSKIREKRATATEAPVDRPSLLPDQIDFVNSPFSYSPEFGKFAVDWNAYVESPPRLSLTEQINIIQSTIQGIESGYADKLAEAKLKLEKKKEKFADEQVIYERSYRVEPKQQRRRPVRKAKNKVNGAQHNLDVIESSLARDVSWYRKRESTISQIRKEMDERFALEDWEDSAIDANRVVFYALLQEESDEQVDNLFLRYANERDISDFDLKGINSRYHIRKAVLNGVPLDNPLLYENAEEAYVRQLNIRHSS